MLGIVSALTLFSSSSALQVPQPEGPRLPSRRAAAGQAAALVPLLASPGIASAGSAGARTGSSYDDRVGSGFGGTGSLRPDLGESVLGSGVEITITDLKYKELDACPDRFFIPAKGGPWSCLEISATAFNQGKRTPTAAEVFGQMYDAEGFACLATSLDPSQKAPIAVLRESFPKGQKKDVKFVVAVQARSPRPFSFAGFKASFRNEKMEKVFEAFDPCEIDSSKCADDEDQPENAAAGLQGKGFSYR